MEEGGLPPPNASSTNSGASTECTPPQQQASIGGADNTSLDERLAVLQELYQRRHAELLTQFQQTQTLAQQDYLLNLQLLQSALPAAAAMVVFQQQQQMPTPAAVVSSSGANSHPLLGSLAQTSSDHSTDQEFDSSIAAVAAAAAAKVAAASQHQHQQPTCYSAPLSKDVGGGSNNVIATTRNRRTFSGSGQTISQHTRDRLKSMIAIKKQKQRLHSSSSTGSSSNIAASMNGTPNWSHSQGTGGTTASELSLLGCAADIGGGQQASIPVSLVNTSHVDQRFCPYPQHPAHALSVSSSSRHNDNDTVTAATLSAQAEFQLRKVNSEPNLKMRIRARLLNKGSSPQQQQQQQTAVAVFPPQPSAAIQRPDSASADPSSAGTAPAIETASLLLQQAAQQALNSQQHHLTAATISSSANMMIPSPSLPNLPTTASFGANGFGARQDGSAGVTLGSQQDLLNLMSLQSSFMHLAASLPSLLKNHPMMPANSMFDTPQSMADSGGGSSSSSNSGLSAPMQRTVRFDNRTPQIGASLGYPSLLKQQLRDLVLRRKSLVREEAEEETMMDFSSSRASGMAPGRAATQIGATPMEHLSGSQLKTGLAYDQSMAKHQCLCADNNNHVEHGGRVQSIWSRLIESGLVSACERVVIRKAPLELLRLVHSPTFVTFFAVSPTACLKLDPSELPLKSFVQLPCGGIGVDSDTYFNDASTQTAAKMAVGSLVELCCQVMEGKLRNGFACIRPPGHHAERELAMGFCFFNNVAIAARFLQQRFASQCQRIAIVDWDVHHGNGTQLCFESDPRCLYISVHRHDNGNFFPGTGAVTEMGIGEGKGTTVNIPFSGDVMGDPEYLAAWRVLVLPLLDAYKPDFVLVSAGFDAALGHPAALGGYNLSPKLFGYLTRSLMQFANGRVVLSLEGGYELSSISDSAEECVKALCSNGGDIGQLSAETLEQIPNLSAQETIQKVIAVHKKYWPCLTGMQGINTSELHWQTINHRFSSLTVHS